MNSPTRPRRMWWLAGVLGLAPLLLNPSPAAAIFPPIYHDSGTPATTPAATTTPTTTTITTPTTTPATTTTTTTTTTPSTPTTTPVASTPEPASIITGLTGLLLAGATFASEIAVVTIIPPAQMRNVEASFSRDAEALRSAVGLGVPQRAPLRKASASRLNETRCSSRFQSNRRGVSLLKCRVRNAKDLPFALDSAFRVPHSTFQNVAQNLPLAFFARTVIVPPLARTSPFQADEVLMSIHAWIVSSLLVGAAPAPPGDAAPVPKLEKGLEITWRGTFSEAIPRPNLRAFRSYDVETRLFVWDVCSQGADVALLTTIKLKPEVNGAPITPAIVRLEVVRVGPRGKLSLLAGDTLVELPEKRKTLPMPLLPMEGLPTLEPSLFVEFPTTKTKIHQAWEVAEERRPNQAFHIESPASWSGEAACKVTMNQQTDDWDKQSIEQAAWRRFETILVSLKRGYAARLERTIEKRDPQSGEIGYRSHLVYEPKEWRRYPDRLGEERRDEVMAAAGFAATFEQLLPEGGATVPSRLNNCFSASSSIWPATHPETPSHFARRSW